MEHINWVTTSFYIVLCILITWHWIYTKTPKKVRRVRINKQVNRDLNTGRFSKAQIKKTLKFNQIGRLVRVDEDRWIREVN